eukprot:TRINITY_DN215_c2_g1_i1.p2 TRINITY_DN215_c2_g1~~TRINITY_DN215_c2_g1_i1.p2  ORF type:complete len:415 (+),score=72.21 TRINITY_DN215_c2_g1_i1:130-1245(+)
MAVLRQAQAVAAISQPLQALNVPRPPCIPTSAMATSMAPVSKPVRSDAAAVAAVAGAAAAAAAAANSIAACPLHAQFSPFQVTGTHVLEKATVAARPRVSGIMSGASGTAAYQPHHGLGSMLTEAQATGVDGTATRVHRARSPSTSVVGQKRRSPGMGRTAAAANTTMVDSSLLTKRASSTSSTTSRFVTQGAAPANENRLHPTAGAGAAGGSTKAATLRREATGKVGRQVTALLSQASDADEDANQEAKKAMRAERNRQSAAASRERKKQYIKELERRVNMLSRENAKMQICQFRLVRERLELESKIVDQVKELKRKLVDRDLEIQKLSKQIESVKLKSAEETDDEEEEIPRPSTWDASEWRSRRSGGVR